MKFVHGTKAKEETIAALATPPGVGGIAIVRISGATAVNSVNLLLRKKIENQSSHSVVLRTLYSPSGILLDRALVLLMRAPRSFTGEDVVEIHCHGGILVARRILEALALVGVRPASPGEFSLRAFLNGKMDLTQAEAIQDLIGAKNEEALRVAEDQLEGRLSTCIRDFQKRATDLAALFEAWVDFPEDDLGFCSFEEALSDLRTLSQDVTTLSLTFQSGKIISHGVAVCILGAPNVGKSSLMNTFLGKDRAIVSPIAGTTRDTLEDDLHMRGLHYRLIDTAGIRETEELIELEGVKRSRQYISKADVILVVLDATRPNDEKMVALVEEVPSHKSIIVWNKIDVAQTPLPLLREPVVSVSAMTGEGIDALFQAIENVVFGVGTIRRDEVMITNVRHHEALFRAQEALERVISGLQTNLSPEFIALEMREVLHNFGLIIGTDVSEDILNAIFSRFCIGK